MHITPELTEADANLILYCADSALKRGVEGGLDQATGIVMVVQKLREAAARAGQVVEQPPQPDEQEAPVAEAASKKGPKG